MTAAVRLRPVKHSTCACGKRGWPTKHDAGQVVVNAKILRHLHGNNRRQEQRTYRCTVNPALWHVTSQHERAYRVAHRPDDDDTAREYLESLLLADGARDTTAAWEQLAHPDYAAQTNALLSLIHQAGLRDGADRKAHLDTLRRQLRSGAISQHTHNVEVAAHKDWTLHWTRFQAVLVARKAQVKMAVREFNIARTETAIAQENIDHRDALRQLTLAVARHRTATASPAAADRALWSVLDTITVPFEQCTATLEDMIAANRWTEFPEERRQP